MLKQLESQYKKILSDYMVNQTEKNLYIAQNFTRQLIQKNISPEDVVSIHKNAVEKIFPDRMDEEHPAYDFLIEVMVLYGMAHREHQSLLQIQAEYEMEMKIATNIQKTLLKTVVPQLSSIDIGMISIPIRKMNGDYVHFLHDRENYLSVAVTDVVGKGVPAALCMSMVKYGLEMIEYAYKDPSHVLEVINRVIEKGVDDSMFVSMFYGCLDIQNSIFSYASAGHEPPLHYSAKHNEFFPLEAKGLLLGVLSETKYSYNEILLEDKDIVIMMTDGVTEFRSRDELNSREIITSLIKENKHVSAQQLCNLLYKQIEKIQDFKLSDDFTVVIIKK
ncbi:PP2C family protein-serine/threonine phosphatase [Lysinibacillus agricola]|uniref:PP2C family protein-serine/threonine phosphatase n=1 Tax=Lysinibacillus agricola TaxID=2590012 RepID=A0ABX7AQL8_9BACI|nr:MULTISPECIES: PP2C family protein-serine/threonine phosphatase [Lysinibacillus]KOS63355.1 phosphoserine phosphatase [Lysinibacillus sp. FJAT-14222]QQP12074.1 PP2C family protein-serine/threonine phosphatase [Lysinibacillus agricola]